MAHVPGLRSPREKVGRLVYFARMLDKIRLHAAGTLPADYVENLGAAKPRVFDARCCEFLGVSYEVLKARVLQGGSDEDVLEWCHQHGTPRGDFDCLLYNTFMEKRGMVDEAAVLLQERIREFGLESYDIRCFFDLLDADEGRGRLKSGG